MRKNLLMIVLFLGIIVRLFFIGNPGFVADISFWKSWSLAAADHGIVWTAHNTNINYPPGFIYPLWLMGKMYALIGDPHEYNSYWRENNFGFLLVSKSIAIVSDVLIALLIYWFFSQKEKLKQLGAVINNSNSTTLLPLVLSAVFFLNPVVILDSAIWGQVESFGLLFTLIAIILIFYKHPLAATVFFTTGTLMKLQNIIFIPLYFLFILRFLDMKTTIRSIGVAVLTFIIITLPFIMAHDMNQVLYLMTVNSDYFPWLSLNANNLWWIVSQAHGMQINDKITVLGIISAKTMGLLLFSASYLFSCILLYKKSSARNLFLSFIIGIFAFFLFTTESHERYSYPVLVLMLFLYPFLINSNLKTQNAKLQFKIQNYYWIIYSLLTISIFFNIHMGLIANYPYNGFGFLTVFTTPTLTIINSVMLIILFLLIIPFTLSELSIIYFAIPFLTLISGIFILNSSYLIKGKVSLLSFKPFSQKQDFSVPQYDKSVNSYNGWKSWNRLSNNYFYYRKGIGSHANSKFLYDINRKFRKFSVDMGIDTEAGTQATVEYKILGDDKELFASGKMGRFDFPHHAEVDVTNIKVLGLIITDAGDGINNDHADWLNPVLYK